VDNTHKKIRTPDAPSLWCSKRIPGRLVARDYEHMAPNIFHSTWCAPSLGEVKTKPLLFFGGGNGVVYAFETVSSNTGESASQASALRKVWQFGF